VHLTAGSLWAGLIPHLTEWGWECSSTFCFEATAVGQIDDDAAAVHYACPVLWAVYDVTCKLPGLSDGTPSWPKQPCFKCQPSVHCLCHKACSSQSHCLPFQSRRGGHVACACVESGLRDVQASHIAQLLHTAASSQACN
jgi:hypothetical protein